MIGPSRAFCLGSLVLGQLQLPDTLSWPLHITLVLAMHTCTAQGVPISVTLGMRSSPQCRTIPMHACNTDVHACMRSGCIGMFCNNIFIRLLCSSSSVSRPADHRDKHICACETTVCMQHTCPTLYSVSCNM